MNAIRQYMKDHNLDDEGMAKVMTEKLGRSIGPSGVKSIKSRKEAPAVWLNALEISPKEPSGLKRGTRVSGAPGAKSTETGVPHIDPIADLPFEIHSARVTIEMIYQMAGKGASMASRTPAVAQLWEQSAPGLADAWLDWAQESPTVANAIAMLTIGGPGGQVILMNASLIIGTLMAIQQQKGIQIIPPQFTPPHEQPEGNEEFIRENTDAAVDHAIRNETG
jgi:hypothetical protein